MKSEPSDRRVFLGMPGYGEVTAGAGRAFWRATKLPDEQVCYRYNEGSLLAANFNTLWAHALNLVHQGRRVDYFAMQHADVEPTDWWLDDLIDELEARDLDVLGVVVPIKDTKGTTSLALAHPNGEDWRILCRLTMTEVCRLPETFTSEDLGHPLLLNTGLWVCRFDPSWVKKVHFTIADRIAFDTRLDAYVAQCIPEDWYVSRLWHALGLKIGATRKIQLLHRGSISFANTHTWGEPFDSAWIDKSAVPDDFGFPHDVGGWLTLVEGKALAGVTEGKQVLEIGSFHGRSTVCIARTAESVVAVDPHDGRGTACPGNTLPILRANLERYGVAEKVEVVVGTLACPEIAEIVDRRAPFDVVFIDGAHDKDSVEEDIAEACSRLASGGVLAFHDYRSSIDPDVTAAVDKLLAAGAELLALHGSLAVVRPPAAVLSTLEV
jgi:16S rRNA G966 N2-methylase RsmD